MLIFRTPGLCEKCGVDFYGGFINSTSSIYGMPNAREEAAWQMVKSMDSGPRLHGFKARLCYLTIWVSYPALGKLLSLSTSISSSVVKVRIVSTSQGYSEH